MAVKSVGEREKQWYWKSADGSQQGPADLAVVRENVLYGVIQPQTEVSATGTDWQPAVCVPELGFDCVVLVAGDQMNVLGPFAREYIDRREMTDEVPEDGILFVRAGTVSEALPGGMAGETGAALVERVMSAEKRVRECLNEKRAAEAALAARDLEFDAERQKFSSEILAIKASLMKLQSERDGLQTDVERSDADRQHAAAVEGRLVDVEQALAHAQSEIKRQSETSAAGRRQAEALKKALSEAESAAEKCRAEQKEMASQLAETGHRLGEREASCVAVEGELAEKREALDALSRRVEELEAQQGELQRAVARAREIEGVLSESAAWLGDRLQVLADEAKRRLTPQSTSGESTGRVAGATDFESVDADVIESASHPQGVRVRPGSRRNAASDPELAKLSAIENQLKREITSLGVSPSPASKSGHDGFIGVFKRRK